MEKVVRIGEYEFPVKSTAASLFSYRRNFGRDGMRDLLALVGGMNPKDNPKDVAVSAFLDGNFEIDTLYRFIWVFAKAGDPSIPPMEEWLDTFEVTPMDFVSDVFPQVTELLFSMAKTTVKSKKKPRTPK